MKKMMKLFMGLIITVMFVACDNNDGPFSERRVNGVTILYSGDKPAKGWVASSITNSDNITITVVEKEVKDGLLSGDFNLYNHFSGNAKAAGQGKLVGDGEYWEGSIVTGRAAYEGLFDTKKLSEYVSRASHEPRLDFDSAMHGSGTSYAIDVYGEFKDGTTKHYLRKDN